MSFHSTQLPCISTLIFSRIPFLKRRTHEAAWARIVSCCCRIDYMCIYRDYSLIGLTRGELPQRNFRNNFSPRLRCACGLARRIFGARGLLASPRLAAWRYSQHAGPHQRPPASIVISLTPGGLSTGANLRVQPYGAGSNCRRR